MLKRRRRVEEEWGRMEKDALINSDVRQLRHRLRLFSFPRKTFGFLSPPSSLLLPLEARVFYSSVWYSSPVPFCYLVHSSSVDILERHLLRLRSRCAQFQLSSVSLRRYLSNWRGNYIPDNQRTWVPNSCSRVERWICDQTDNYQLRRPHWRYQI